MSADVPPVLEIVIVNADGGRELLRACLDSLESNPLCDGQMRVWVVDNASTDGATEMVRHEFPSVSLLALSSNAGFCVANNLVLRQVSAPYALLLNPDTEVSPGALDHMVALMEERREIGMAGCRLVRRDGTFDHAAKRSFPTPIGALAHFVGVGRWKWSPSWLAQYRAPGLGEHDSGAVDSVNGAFMLVRREAVEAVGLLDERYWLFMEDLDWAYRFKQAGWVVWYEGSVTILHVKGGTHVLETRRARHRGLRHTVAFHRSMGRFYRKFYAGNRPALDALVYLAIGVKLAIASLRSAVAHHRVPGVPAL